MITRPNTGTLAYELDLYELLEKYVRVPDEEQAIAAVQYAWTQVIHSTGVQEYVLVAEKQLDAHLFGKRDHPVIKRPANPMSTSVRVVR